MVLKFLTSLNFEFKLVLNSPPSFADTLNTSSYLIVLFLIFCIYLTHLTYTYIALLFSIFFSLNFVRNSIATTLVIFLYLIYLLQFCLKKNTFKYDLISLYSLPTLFVVCPELIFTGCLHLIGRNAVCFFENGGTLSRRIQIHSAFKNSTIVILTISALFIPLGLFLLPNVLSLLLFPVKRATDLPSFYLCLPLCNLHLSSSKDFLLWVLGFNLSLLIVRFVFSFEYKFTLIFRSYTRRRVTERIFILLLIFNQTFLFSFINYL
jgi:hypothetical protein